MNRVLVAAASLLAVGSVVAQTTWAECPASQSCVYMLPPDFLALSAEDGAQLGYAIVMVWAVAWGVRVLARLVPTQDGKPDE